MHNYDRRSRTAAQESPEAEAKKLAADILADLEKDPQYDGWAEPLAAKILAEAKNVRAHRSFLVAQLKDVIKGRVAVGQAQAIKDAHFVFEGRVQALLAEAKNLTDKLEADEKSLKPLRTNVEKVLELCAETSEWYKPKVESKGKTNLGSPFKWDVAEITREGLSYKSYITKTDHGQYRIAPETPGKDGWRLDKGHMTWEAMTETVYKTPNEAAADLAKILGVNG